MALNARQAALYQSLCSIWRVSRTIAADGKPGSDTITRIATGVPCHYQYTDNIGEPVEAIGRVERMLIVTTDWIHMEQGVDVRDSDYLRNETILPDGTEHPNYGDVHRVLGLPKVNATSARRRPNKLKVGAMRIEDPPAVIS